MNRNRRNTILATAATLILPFALQTPLLQAQAARAGAVPEGYIPTQMLIRPESKQPVIPSMQNLVVELDKKPAQLLALNRVQPNGTQIALLIDDGLSRSAGIQLQDIKKFILTLPPGTELLLGYMQNGRVITAAPFSTDHAAAAAALRLPMGVPGESASPYFCLQEFVKNWPGSGEAGGAIHQGKARFVMMLTNGVDLYNGSTSITNQNSPYVQAALDDAQRAGVAVSSIYYRDAGFGGRGAFSGQSYLQQLAEGTGGEAYYQGLGNPVSLTPFFEQFAHAISETYVATFAADAQAGGRDHLVRTKVTASDQPRLKFRYPEEVRPGNREAEVQNTAMVTQP
jgi:hypothetical protein